MGCLAVLGEHDLRIPDDISVGAFDNSEWLGIWRPPMTAVDVAIQEISAWPSAAAAAHHGPVSGAQTWSLIP